MPVCPDGPFCLCLSCVQGVGPDMLMMRFECVYECLLVLCTASSCVAYTYGVGVVDGDASPCSSGVSLTQGSTCTVKCGVGYVGQSGTISCASGATQGDPTSGALTCVGGWLVCLVWRVLCFVLYSRLLLFVVVCVQHSLRPTLTRLHVHGHVLCSDGVFFSSFCAR